MLVAAKENVTQSASGESNITPSAEERSSFTPSTENVRDVTLPVAEEREGPVIPSQILFSLQTTII